MSKCSQESSGTNAPRTTKSSKLLHRKSRNISSPARLAKGLEANPDWRRNERIFKVWTETNKHLWCDNSDCVPRGLNSFVTQLLEEPLVVFSLNKKFVVHFSDFVISSSRNKTKLPCFTVLPWYWCWKCLALAQYLLELYSKRADTHTDQKFAQVFHGGVGTPTWQWQQQNWLV